MNMIESFIEGMISGLGMVIIMTIFGFITFRVARKWITKTIADIWATVRTTGVINGLEIDGSLKTKIKRRKINERHDKNDE